MASKLFDTDLLGKPEEVSVFFRVQTGPPAQLRAKTGELR
jgi:hypothetical protein